MTFELMERYGDHEQVMYFKDRSVGLKAMVAIHSNVLGPALGGCRLWDYQSEKEALKDVLKLSRGMTYKAAISNLNLGGGKAVIIGKTKSPEMFRAFGRSVETLNGKYITAEDVGTTPQDMLHIRSETSHVVGLAKSSGGSGDPSPFTAKSTLQGMKASVFHKWKRKSVEGLKVVVQGIGHVGKHLCRFLQEEGCEVVVTDICPQKISSFAVEFPKVQVVSPDKVYEEECDIFSPCALGGVLNSQNIARLKCQIVAGAANNQLETLKNQKDLQKYNILYTPDFVINSGGLINVSEEVGGGYSKNRVDMKIQNVYETVLNVFYDMNKNQTGPADIAIEMAIRKIHQKKTSKKLKFKVT